jgi:CubicO group peptidase (beta-lactamase class C family)
VHGFQGYPPGGPLPTLDKMLAGTFPANNEAIAPVQAPGKEYYSGGGIMVTQKILLDRFKQPYPFLVNKYIFQSLKLKASTYNQPLRVNQQAVAAKGYRIEQNDIKDITSVYPDLAAAGLWTTPSELAKIVIALQKSLTGDQETLLSFKAATDMMTPVMGFGGLGVALQTIGGYRYFSHNGENQGFVCQFIGSIISRSFFLPCWPLRFQETGGGTTGFPVGKRV